MIQMLAPQNSVQRYKNA